jgi:hypothetical protein
MVFVIVSKLRYKFVWCSLDMSELVGDARGRSDEVAKIRVEGVINKGNENVWAEAWCRSVMSSVLMVYNGSRGLERIKLMHPCG